MGNSDQTSQSYTSTNPCPICGGDKAKGCHGFRYLGSAVAHCSQIDSPGEPTNGSYPHRLDGSCPCGSDHGDAPASPPAADLGPPNTWHAKATAIYQYRDEHRDLLFEVVRFGSGPGKKFRQRHLDPSNRWIGHIKGVRRVPYLLPELIEAKQRGDEIFITEGEKDAVRLNKLFLETKQPAFATCNPMGANSWRPEYAAFFAGASKITIWRDRDQQGHLWTGKVFASVLAVAPQIRVVESHSGKDAFDHVEAGLGIDRVFDVTPKDSPGEYRAPADFLSTEEFETDSIPEAIVEGIVYPRSVTMMNGPAKVGKSIFVTQLVMAVANGDPFLDLPVQQTKVLHLSLEMTAALVRERMKKIERDVGIARPAINDQLFMVAPTKGTSPGLNLKKPADLENLYRLIKESGAGLVVLDTLYRFIPGLDMNDNSEMGEIMDALLRVANETGAGILILHHVRKGDGTAYTSQSGLGAQIFGGAANVIVTLGHANAAWEVSIDSHYGSRETPLTYRQPQKPDGTLGMGCVPCTAMEAEAVEPNQIVNLFKQHGQQWDQIEDEGLRQRTEAGLHEQGLTTSGAIVFKSRRELEGVVEASRLRRSPGAARHLVGTLIGSAGLIRVDASGHGHHLILVSGGETFRAAAESAPVVARGDAAL